MSAHHADPPIEERGGGPAGPGAVIRRARRAAGMTLAEFGARCGYSAAQMSRIERGRAPLTVDQLRRFADLLDLPPETLGLLPLDPPNAPNSPRQGRQVRTVMEREPDGTQWRDRVRRRQLLAGTAGLAVGAAACMLNAPAHRSTASGEVRGHLAARIRDALLGLHSGDGATPAAMQALLARADADFAACRYAALAGVMPRLVAAGQTYAGDEAVVPTVASIYTLAPGS